MEPVVEGLGGGSPLVVDASGIKDGDFGHFGEEDGFGGGEGEVVLIDDDAEIGDGDVLILVEDFHFFGDVDVLNF